MIKNYVKCAFVNSDELPVKTEVVEGYFVKEGRDNKLELNSYYRVHYPHPDAPNEAMLSVLEHRTICEVKPNDKHYPAIYMLFQAQKNVSQAIGK
jgi:hypothetical protein